MVTEKHVRLEMSLQLFYWKILSVIEAYFLKKSLYKEAFILFTYAFIIFEQYLLNL